MAVNLPRLQQTVPLVDQAGQPSMAFHVWWDQFAKALETALTNISDQVAAIAAAQAAADAAQMDATNALNQLTDIASDNKLSPVEKTVVIQDYSVITTEQTDIDAKATTYGITTEKTGYDNAVSALTSYLATLTTPVAWNDTSGTTDIVGTTFRSKFADVYTTKQLLLNKLHDTAKTLADGAQTAANTVKRDDKISSSSVVPAIVLSATDAGTSASITVAAHTRLYGDATSHTVSSHTFTGLAYSTDYAVYYDDTTVSNTSPTYQTTTTLSHALNGYAAGRHFVGTITTPAAGAADTSGGTVPEGTDPTYHNRFDTV